MIEPIFKERRRIAKPLLKNLPQKVAERVEALAVEYRIKSATVLVYQHGWKLYAGEGDRFEFIMGEETASVEMVHSNTVGAAGLAHDIGTIKTPPVGAWIIRIHYYTKYWMDIIYTANEKDGQLPTVANTLALTRDDSTLYKGDTIKMLLDEIQDRISARSQAMLQSTSGQEDLVDTLDREIKQLWQASETIRSILGSRK